MADLERGHGTVAWPRETKEQAWQLYKQGTPLDAIAEKLKVPFYTLARWSSNQKWKHQLAAGSSSHDKSAPIGECNLRITGQTFEEKQNRYKEELATQALRIAETIAELDKDRLLPNADKIAKLDATARKALNLETSTATTVINIGFLRGQTEKPLTIVRELTAQPLLTQVIDTGMTPADSAPIEVEPEP